MDYLSQAVNSKVCHHIWEHLLSSYEYQLDGNENLLGRYSISFNQVGYWNFVFIDCTTCMETFCKVECSRTISIDRCIVIIVTYHIKFIV